MFHKGMIDKRPQAKSALLFSICPKAARKRRRAQRRAVPQFAHHRWQMLVGDSIFPEASIRSNDPSPGSFTLAFVFCSVLFTCATPIVIQWYYPFCTPRFLRTDQLCFLCCGRSRSKARSWLSVKAVQKNKHCGFKWGESWPNKNKNPATKTTRKSPGQICVSPEERQRSNKKRGRSHTKQNSNKRWLPQDTRL